MTAPQSPSLRIAMPELPEAGLSVMDALRACTRNAHDQIEGNPLSAALVAQSLPLSGYKLLLCVYEELHLLLEKALSRATHPVVQSLWSEERSKLPYLRADLTVLGALSLSLPAAVSEAIDTFAKTLKELADEAPIAWLGMFYVLEGSTLGGQVLKTHIKQAYGFEEEGFSYFTPYERPGLMWRAFKQEMNDAIQSDEEKRLLLQAATLTFLGMDQILRVLFAVSLPGGGDEGELS